MKKMLCALLTLLMCPMLAMAEDTGASTLGSQELTDWAESFISRALSSQPLNDPAQSLTADGYEFIYPFATLYADSSVMDEDATVNAIVLTSEEETGPRHVNVNSALNVVLNAYYHENPELSGSRDSAVLYTMDRLPESASWAKVLRDGQRVQTVQYAVHEQLATGGDGYTDMGVIYTMADNRVSAVRVYGLNSRVSLQEVNDVMLSTMTAALEDDYAQVPFSYDGSGLTAFGPEDVYLSGVNFLTLTPEDAVAMLGQPLSDTWMDDGDNGYTRKQVFPSCELIYEFNRARSKGQVYMLYITDDDMEGPRAVRVGDSFTSVYNRFRNGEGEYQDNGSEILYGTPDSGSFGEASYGGNASATLRYGFTAPDGRKVVLHLNFTVMECTEIMLYVD